MLRFRPEPSGAFNGELVRESYFEPITDLPISAVCLAANHARAQLSRLFARELTLDVFAPALVKDGLERVLFERSTVYRARGVLCDVVAVFRARDACRIARGVFGEDADDEQAALSSLEVRALERIAREVVALCVPFCGEVGAIARIDAEHERPTCVTYFELRIGSPLDAVIGIGLSKDPGPTFGGTLDRAVLSDVALEVRAQFAEATQSAHDVAKWSVGMTVCLDTKIGAPTKLKVGDCVVASGDCGIRAQSHAVAIRSISREEVVS